MVGPYAELTTDELEAVQRDVFRLIRKHRAGRLLIDVHNDMVTEINDRLRRARPDFSRSPACRCVLIAKEPTP